MKSLPELINEDEPGWEIVRSWVDEATNPVEVLNCSKQAGEKTLYECQVTTRSPMGAIAYQSGGLLVDDGWLRIFGAGCDRLPISLSQWNLGKTLTQFGESAPFWIVADDAIGGIYAINGGQLGDDLGKVYYFALDSLEWESMDIGYSDFIWWTLTGDLLGYYQDLRWNDWREEVKQLPGDRVISFYPFLSAQAESIESRHRGTIPVNESYGLFVGKIIQGD